MGIIQRIFDFIANMLMAVFMMGLALFGLFFLYILILTLM